MRDARARALQAERLQRAAGALLLADGALVLVDPERAEAVTASSSSDVMAGLERGPMRTPRISATVSIDRSWPSAFIVAHTTFTGLDEPRDFERMSWMPADSTTARTDAAGDDARSLGGRPEQHLRRAEVGRHRVRDRPLHERHEHDVLLRVLDALLDRVGHLVRLAEPRADVAAAVTDHHDRREAEAAAALDDLGDAVDLHHALRELEPVAVDLQNCSPPLRAASASAFTRPW